MRIQKRGTQKNALDLKRECRFRLVDLSFDEVQSMPTWLWYFDTVDGSEIR